MLDFSNADIEGTPITASTVNLKGPSNLNGASITVSNSAVVSSISQLTLSNSAQFIVSPNAQVSQNAALSIFPAGQNNPPLFTNNGKWTSTSTLMINVRTAGTGSYQFGTGAQTTITGISFVAGTLTLTSASFTSISSTVTVGSISGTGTIISQGPLFIVTGSIVASSYMHANGITQLGSGNINTLDVQNGVYNFTGTGASVGALTFEGGTIAATPGSSALLAVGSLTLTDPNPAQPRPKTFVSITITVQSLSLV